jgi:hypothetical protein
MAGLVPAIHVLAGKHSIACNGSRAKQRDSDQMAVALVPGIHILTFDKTSHTKTWMAGTSPRLSGSIFVDRVHDGDSSVF